MHISNSSSRKAAVIVAHPDDETLWAGGKILQHPRWEWTVVALCRGSDPDRAPRFSRAMQYLNCSGKIGDLDDSPEQLPLDDEVIQKAVLSLLPRTSFDFLLTHSPHGEYTRHRRHEETGRAVAALWEKGLISTSQLWMFAYDDDNKKHLPEPIKKAHRIDRLPVSLWLKKYHIITDIYGFTPESFEARTTPENEAFWCFRSPREFREWFQRKGERHESTCAL